IRNIHVNKIHKCKRLCLCGGHPPNFIFPKQLEHIEATFQSSIDLEKITMCSELRYISFTYCRNDFKHLLNFPQLQQLKIIYFDQNNNLDQYLYQLSNITSLS